MADLSKPSGGSASADCAEVRDGAAEMALGILPPAEEARLRAHVEGCPDCHREVGQLRAIGDLLLDLVPDAEPPLGLDRKVLRRLTQPRWRRHGMIYGAVAAAVTLIAAVTATAVALSGHSGRSGDLTAALSENGHRVGSVYVGGHPAWVSMTVHDVGADGPVSCQVLSAGGRAVTVGTFQLVRGSGSWGAPEPMPTVDVSGARLVSASGVVIATAAFSGS